MATENKPQTEIKHSGFVFINLSKAFYTTRQVTLDFLENFNFRNRGTELESQAVKIHCKDALKKMNKHCLQVAIKGSRVEQINVHL